MANQHGWHPTIASRQFGADVAMSESAYREIELICVAEPLGPVKVKGREQPITVFKLISMTVPPEASRGPGEGR